MDVVFLRTQITSPARARLEEVAKRASRSSAPPPTESESGHRDFQPSDVSPRLWQAQQQIPPPRKEDWSLVPRLQVMSCKQTGRANNAIHIADRRERRPP